MKTEVQHRLTYIVQESRGYNRSKHGLLSRRTLTHCHGRTRCAITRSIGQISRLNLLGGLAVNPGTKCTAHNCLIKMSEFGVVCFKCIFHIIPCAENRIVISRPVINIKVKAAKPACRKHSDCTDCTRWQNAVNLLLSITVGPPRPTNHGLHRRGGPNKALLSTKVEKCIICN